MCHVCGKIFTSDKNLSEHLNSGLHSEKNHNCDKCEKTFQYKKGLLRHKKTAHEEKKFKDIKGEKLLKCINHINSYNLD